MQTVHNSNLLQKAPLTAPSMVWMEKKKKKAKKSNQQEISRTIVQVYAAVCSCFGIYFWDGFKFELDHSNEQYTQHTGEHRIQINVHLPLKFLLLLCCRNLYMISICYNLIHTQKRESHRIWHWSMEQWTVRGSFTSNSKCSWIWKSTVGTEWHPINHIRFLASSFPSFLSVPRHRDCAFVASIARAFLRKFATHFSSVVWDYSCNLFCSARNWRHQKKKRTVIYGCGCVMCAQAHKTPNIFVRGTCHTIVKSNWIDIHKLNRSMRPEHFLLLNLFSIFFEMSWIYSKFYQFARGMVRTSLI